MRAAALQVADLELDLLARTACRGDASITLQPREFTLLDEAALASRGGSCVGGELDQALEEIRGINATFEALDLAPLLVSLAEVYEVVFDRLSPSEGR